nr:hypothetical protein [Tanacetum cinerariifolium]
MLIFCGNMYQPQSKTAAKRLLLSGKLGSSFGLEIMQRCAGIFYDMGTYFVFETYLSDISISPPIAQQIISSVKVILGEDGCGRVMSSSPYSTIIPFDSDIENTFSSTNILNYFSASSGSISPDSSNNFTKYLSDILVFLPLHDVLKMEFIQAYDAIPSPQVVTTLPAILPPSPVVSLLPMFDS